MEPTPKTNELYCDPYGSKYIRGSEELQQTRLPFQGRASTMNHVVSSINHYRKYHNIP